MFAGTSASPSRRSLPPDYPSELESDVALNGVELHIRPIVPGDADHLRRSVAEADPRDLYLRFFVTNPHLDDEDFERLTTVDYRRRLALTAWHRRLPVAIARYEPTDEAGTAEVAFAVRREYRHLGLATHLVNVLAAAAVERGYRRLSAVYLAENEAADRVLAKAGFTPPVEEDGVLETSRDLI